MHSLRPKLTYANVAATLALFVALGGGAYAALSLPKNSVGTKQLKQAAVSGQKVKSGTLRAKHFKGGQLGPRAYATYDPEANALVPAQSKKLTLESASGSGEYCLDLAPGINAAKTSPVVGADRPLVGGIYADLPFPTLIEPGQFVCPDADLAVQTFHFSSGSFSTDDEVAFRIVVP